MEGVNSSGLAEQEKQLTNQKQEIYLTGGAFPNRRDHFGAGGEEARDKDEGGGGGGRRRKGIDHAGFLFVV